MQNRHGFFPKEADRLLESISENWNAEIGNAELSPRNHTNGHTRRQMQAIMAAMINLQFEYSYDEVIRFLEHLHQQNAEAMVKPGVKHCIRLHMAAQNIFLVRLIRLFNFLKSNTYNA